MWIRPIFTERRRLLQGASDNLLVEMRLTDPEKYFNYLRMSPTIFTELFNIVGPLIEKQNVVRKPILARTRLEEKVLIDSTEENWSTIAGDFKTTCQFPHCIGAIDGKYVEIQAPPRSGSCYYNYKGKHSINLLAVSDAKNRFTIVDIGAEGWQSDGGVFENSALPHLLETNALPPYPSTYASE
ncbi:nuclease harbi1-like protein [Lasius niger]|uniref:Nuclease harbi1-like protein n=1 Tax=Lasius niger TaxID=67767 RepID=A0A0J7K5L5_LASNI|nr:nuclease harbi1-like protein [Lasius niger]